MAPLETPPLRVSRPVSACARCRAAKVKCDGKLPACSSCERSGKAKDCSSANDQFAKGKERSYVASLESRIEKLQRQIALSKNQVDIQQGATQLNSYPNPQSVHSRHNKPDSSDVDELVTDFGYLAVNATASGYQGFMQEMSFARLVLSTASVEDMPKAEPISLPPREVAAKLMQDCVDKIFLIYPIIPQPVLFGSLELAYQYNGRYCPPQDIWNLRLVLAIAYLCQSRVYGDENYRHAFSHAAVALDQRESVLQPGSIGTVQALLLLVVYSMLDPTHYDCWYLIGVAARLMVDIGLHQELEVDADMQLKPAQLETRRRVFYSVYALDRAISMSFVRCFSFSDDSINVSLPHLSGFHPISNYNQPHSMHLSTSPALEVYKFRQIQSDIFQSVFASSRSNLSAPWQSRTQLVRNMSDWISALPESTPESLKRLLLSEMFYLDVLLVLPQGTDSSRLDHYGKALLFDFCMGYTRNMCLICDDSWKLYPISCLDLRRTLLIAQITVNLLTNDLEVVVEQAFLSSTSISTYINLPPLQRSLPSEKMTQIVNTLTQMRKILNMLISRFGSYLASKQVQRSVEVLLQSRSFLHQY